MYADKTHQKNYIKKQELLSKVMRSLEIWIHWLNGLNILQFSSLMLFKSIVFEDDHAVVGMGGSTSVDVRSTNQSYRWQTFLDAITLSFKFSKMLLLYASFTWQNILPAPWLLSVKNQGSVQWYFCCSST